MVLRNSDGASLLGAKLNGVIINNPSAKEDTHLDELHASGSM